MKILLFLAKGFETMEFSVFVDVLGWARNDYGCDIMVETCGFTRQVVSTFGIPVIVDKLIEEIHPEDYAALAIPGGFEEYGFYEEAFDPALSKLIQTFDEQRKTIASVCVAALALGKSGILASRKATTYHLKGGYRQKQLAEYGVHVVNEPIVTDEHIITSFCPETAPEVAFRLLERLTDTEQMNVVREAMGYQQSAHRKAADR